ncbi:MAG TPA: acetyltransferase [Azospirillaceae bacterium]|nr:acetyltransferase [Azospirillaceae bacterium]
MFSVRPSTSNDIGPLFEIWHAAVRSTHGFLTEADIDVYARYVREEYLPGTEFLVAVDGSGKPIGFMGVTGQKIDALFVDPAWHKKGVGRTLVASLLEKADGLTVDVNEQNHGARRFYASLGFHELGRSESDGSGRPFPLIHLAHGHIPPERNA